MPQLSSQTIKQERESRRAEKVAALKRQQARERRIRIGGWIAAGAGAIAVVTLVVVVVVSSAAPKPNPDDISITGLSTFGDLTKSVHVDTTVDYEATYDMNPPAGGDHAAAWLNCGVYSEPQQNENAVHSLEHGAVWVTYDPDVVDAAGITTIRAQLPSTYVVLSPYPGLPAPVVASAWGNQVQLTGVDDPRLGDFVDKFWRSADAPEPTASCSNAIDGPGKVA